jgi:GxxExxY protein
MTENQISYLIRGCIFNVYNALGPGLLENVYHNILRYDLEKQGLKVESEVALPVYYDGIKHDFGYRIDLIVEEKVLIEIKSVEQIHSVHHKQVLTYLKLSGIKLGILVNFNCDEISKNIIRKIM